MKPLAALPLLLLALTGCPTEDGKRTRTPEDFGVSSNGESVPLDDGRPKAIDHTHDAPEISRSRGTKGGVIVLWPRIWPETGPKAHDLAAKVQARIAELAKRAAGARTMDIRPDPERSCPLEGCEATSVSAVIAVRGESCALVAFAAGPGTSPGHLLPWAGKVTLTSDTVAVRDPPEKQVKVVDYVKCDTLLDGVEERETAIARYITGLMPGG